MPDDGQPDFGKGGKITIRTHETGVQVNLTAGESLFYRLRVEGAVPSFAWACEHKPRLNATDFPGHPKQTYEWTWCRGNSTDRDAGEDDYGVEMRFTAAVKYTLEVEHRDRQDGLIKQLKDIDYESQFPEDGFVESLTVFS